MQRCLGQFSVIGMLRLHTILGDYTTALEVLETIELRTNVTYITIYVFLCMRGY